ncbi:unnamed protein product [Chironomus riparius]|uniref:Ionotropic receptor n=1 Tax=Chironomus riparius TaxID=315576 RepID=A0A9N9S4F3_9DIPT|nr:unnamed protein product [Chironomus riparius]
MHLWIRSSTIAKYPQLTRSKSNFYNFVQKNMKIARLFALFLALLIFNSTFSTKFILKTLQNDDKLSNYVCKVTKDIISSKSDTQDVLIGNLGGKMWSLTVNDITGCIGSLSAVVVTNFEDVMTEKTLNKAAVMIVMFGDVNQVLMQTFLKKYIKSTVWNHSVKLIGIVKDQMTWKQQMVIINHLTQYSFLNFALIANINQRILTITMNTFLGIVHVTDKLLSGDLLFPDKLKNLHNYPYRVPICEQSPRVVIQNRVVQSPWIYFLIEVTKLQNASADVDLVDDCRELITLWKERKMDLSINTAVVFPIDSNPKLLTYEENSYCALVPLPPETSSYHLTFLDPFDGLTWMFFVLTMTCSVAVWLMFRHRGAVDSPWLLAYSIFVMFIGQGVHFNPHNRLVLVILLQLMIFMIFVLSSAYEGVITSFMIQPIQDNRLETLDDLVASDYEIFCPDAFIYIIKNIGMYNQLKARLNTSRMEVSGQFEEEILRQKSVFVMECDRAELILGYEMDNDQILYDYYYILKHKLFPQFVRLEASYLNPFIERLQDYMDISFQAGLLHIWKVFMHLSDLDQFSHKPLISSNILKLENLIQVFSVLVIGYVLSAVVLLIEIFFYDTLKNLKLAVLAQKLRNRVSQMAYKKRKQPKHPKYQKGALYYIIHRRKRVKRLRTRKLKVRRIYVQPRFPMD